ncbi:hypothetical protein [Sphingomonas radiodurans]|uniref:hypothetical protein n=1 Tax=Sphingomonas radiodurans TaxID=2890321 RepID=UPI001E452462|nr:hypothetical protein [Sphingomonas radiodurans]WBH17572.1 hypothetical protein LLW23_05555 [Sphingomonas radiodurans]
MTRACLPAAMATVLAVGPAVAQTPPGSFGRSSNVVTQSDLSRQMALCALRLNRDASRRFILAQGDDAEKRKSVKSFHATMVTCLSGARSATLDPISVEGAFAEALMQENDGALLTKAAGLPAVDPVRIVPTQGSSAQYGVVECAVRARPDVAARMLRSKPETVEEAGHFRELAPALQGCVPLTGKISLKPFHVRSLVAGALYRRVTTDAGVAGRLSDGRDNAQA